jgi:hypothetical protein
MWPPGNVKFGKANRNDTFSLRRFSVFVCCRKTFHEVRRNWSVLKRYLLNNMSKCLYSCVSYQASKVYRFYATLHYQVWPVWL